MSDEGDLAALRAELAALKKQNEKLAAAAAAPKEDKKKKKRDREAAKLRAEIAAAKSEGAKLGAPPAAPPADKPKKKKRKTRDDAAAQRLRAELAAVRGETAALGGPAADAPPAVAAPKKRSKADAPAAAAPKKRSKADAPAAAPAAKAPRDGGVPRLYVAGLPYGATEETIARYFETLCGGVRGVELKGFDDNPDRFCGIAFVTFADADACDAALALDGASFGGDDRTMKIRRDYKAPRRPPPARVGASLTVYAGNMPWDASRDDVEAHFSEHGCAVAGMRYHTDAATGQFRGFVHLECADEASLSKALALAGTRFRGRELRVSHSETAKRKNG